MATTRSLFSMTSLSLAVLGMFVVAPPAAQAIPAAYGLFAEGGIPPGAPYFGDAEAYDSLYFENYSTTNDSITEIQVDLSTASSSLFLDTSILPPGDSLIFFPVMFAFQVGAPSLNTITGDTDGSTLLTFTFNSFGPGEGIAFLWDVDGGTYPFPPGPGEIVSEPDFTGTTFRVTFDSGKVLSGIFQPRTSDGAIFSAEARVVAPEPGSLSLMVLGLSAVALITRRRLSRQG